LYACEHAFRARQPLPQFLPSAQHAHATLISRLEQSMHNSQRELGLSRLYLAAEGEVLSYLVDTLENMLSIGRTLFGTAEWLTGGALSVHLEMDPDDDPEGHHEWHGVE